MKTKKLALNDKQFHSWKLESGKPKSDLAVVMLHGAGASDSTRALPLALMFEAAGIPAVSLDFFGHGKTGGKLSETSIAERIEQAKTAIDFWLEKDTALILCGFSLSGHVALCLSKQLGDRVKALGLFCPAIYAKEAETIPFGAEFSRVIRQEGSWHVRRRLRLRLNFRVRLFFVLAKNKEWINQEKALYRPVVEAEIEEGVQRREAEFRKATPALIPGSLGSAEFSGR